MKKSVFFKVFGGHVILLLSLAVVFLLFSFSTIKKHDVERLARDLEKVGRTLELRIFDFIDQGRLGELEAFLREHGKKIGARLTVIDPEGVVKADSEKDPAGMEGHRFRPEIVAALEGRQGRSLRYSSTLKTRMLYVALPLKRSGRTEGVLRLSLFVRDIDVLLSAIRRDIGRAVCIILLLSLAAAFFLSRSLTRPMRALIQASKQVSAGDFRTRVRVRSSDEWKDLAESFNSMTAEVQTLFEDLRKRKEELDNIIASMQEGLLVIDRAGKIMLANSPARDLIGQEANEGKYFWEAIRLTPFVELVRRVQDEKKMRTREILFGEKNIYCRASFLPAQEGVVVTLQDVTEIQNLARIKKDFAVNVAHELRTPLAAIRGYAETLEDQVDEPGTKAFGDDHPACRPHDRGRRGPHLLEQARG